MAVVGATSLNHSYVLFNQKEIISTFSLFALVLVILAVFTYAFVSYNNNDKVNRKRCCAGSRDVVLIGFTMKMVHVVQNHRCCVFFFQRTNCISQVINS